MNPTTANIELVEITTFRLREGVDTQEFLKETELMQKHFLDKQPGFVRRLLTASEDGTWTDIVYWESHHAIEQAIQAAQTDEAVGPFMQMIDMASANMRMAKPQFPAEAV